jgi:glyoxylase-like metal-dependent hydrolase (beta-lactamase superfamily II)
MTLPSYEVLALKYATRPARRVANFVGGDPHDIDMPMDYFVWSIRDAQRTVVVDTGFAQDMAVKRHRTLLRTPREAFALVGIDTATVADVVITHFHNDHAGTFDTFDRATFHVQDDEMAFTTGRKMRHQQFSRPYEPDHVAGLIRLVYDNRVEFHDGDGEIAPGISVHRIGGHTAGLQVVRVHTARGWVVLASDASHYYEHFERDRVFPLVHHMGETVEGYRRLKQLAASPRHVVPGHDPRVLERYPAPSEALRGIAARLDVDPTYDDAATAGSAAVPGKH